MQGKNHRNFPSKSGKEVRIRYEDDSRDPSQKSVSGRGDQKSNQYDDVYPRPIEVLEVASPPKTGLLQTHFQTQKSKPEIFRESKSSKLDKAVRYFKSRSLLDMEHTTVTSPELLKVEEDTLGNGNADDEQTIAWYSNSARPRERPKVEADGPSFRNKGRTTEISNSAEHRGVVNRCVFNHDSTLMLTVSGDCACHLFRRLQNKTSVADSWTKEATLEGHQIGVWGAAISLNDDFVFTVGGDGKIRFWLMGTKIPPQMDAVEIRKILGKRGEKSTGTQAEIFARLKVIMSREEDIARRDGFYEQYVKSERRWLCAQVLGDEPAATGTTDRGAAFDCALHPSNDVVATAWGDGAVRIYRGVRAGTTRCESPRGFMHERWAWVCMQTMRDHADSIFRCCFDRCGGTLVTASKDGTMWLYSAQPGGFERLRSLSGHMGPVLGLSCHPCCRLIASGSCDSNVVMWFLADLEGAGATWVSIATLFGHEDYVKACCFRDDGQLLATASRDRTVRLWKVTSNPTSAGQLRRFKCLEIIRCSEEVSCVQFGSGSQTAILVTGTVAGSIYFWNTNTCLQCARPFDSREVMKEIFTSPTLQGTTENVIFKDEGRVMSVRPLTAMSDWSGMETPNHTATRRPTSLVPRKALTVHAATQPVVYAQAEDEDVSSSRFHTMGGSDDDQTEAAASRRIKDFTAETMLAKATLAHSRRSFSDVDVKKVKNIANVILQESGLKHFVKLKDEALIAILENVVFLDSQSITDALSKCIHAIENLLKLGKLEHRFPELKRHKYGRRWHFGKTELEYFLRTHIATLAARHSQDRHGNRTHTGKFLSKDDQNTLEPNTLDNARGAQLALDLSMKTIAEAKRILGERIVQLIEPELTWTKEERRLAGNIATRMLSTFNENQLHSENFKNICCLVFNKRLLYTRALDVLQELKAGDLASVLPKIVRSAAENLSVDSLTLWTGEEGAAPTVQNRLSSPLYSSAVPTTIGTVFRPRKGCKIVRFIVYLSLATTQTTREARDRDRRQASGVSFKFLVLKWDIHSKKSEDILYMSEEKLVTEHGFERFLLNFESIGDIHASPDEVILIALSSSSCASYCKGAAWISGVGHPDKVQARKGVKYPDPPQELSLGTYVFAGLPDGDPRNVWVKLDEILACHIDFHHE